ELPLALEEGDKGGRQPAFGAVNATLPIIGCLFEMDGTGFSTAQQETGVTCYAGSAVYVLPKCGVMRAARYGLYCAMGSRAIAAESIWRNSASCVRADDGSVIVLAYGFSEAFNEGVGYGA